MGRISAGKTICPLVEKAVFIGVDTSGSRTIHTDQLACEVRRLLEGLVDPVRVTLEIGIYSTDHNTVMLGILPMKADEVFPIERQDSSAIS